MCRCPGWFLVAIHIADGEAAICLIVQSGGVIHRGGKCAVAIVEQYGDSRVNRQCDVRFPITVHICNGDTFSLTGCAHRVVHRSLKCAVTIPQEDINSASERG